MIIWFGDAKLSFELSGEYLRIISELLKHGGKKFAHVGHNFMQEKT